MQQELAQIHTEFEGDLNRIDSLDSWGAVRDKYLSRKSGLLTQAMKLTGKLPPEQRAAFGQDANALKSTVEAALEQARAELDARAEALRLEREAVDVTLPGRKLKPGHLHPITLIRQRIEDIFVAMGYAVEDGPEVETDFYNFTALNIPELHPARSPQDTFYTTDGLSLRSQTSTVQIHAMQRRRPPLRVVAPGRVFRRDTPDATHNPMFFQVEGLLVDRGINMGHLKGTLTEFVHRLFGPNRRRTNSESVPFKCPICTPRSTRSPSTWKNIGLCVASGVSRRKTRPGAMIRRGAPLRSIALICTVEVCERKASPSVV